MVYNWFCEFERKFQSIINLIFIMDLIILLCHESCNSISTSQCVFNKDIYNTNFPYSIIVSYNYQIIKYFLIKKMAYYLFFKVVVRYKRGQILQIEYYNPSYKLQQWNFLKKEKRKKKRIKVTIVESHQYYLYQHLSIKEKIEDDAKQLIFVKFLVSGMLTTFSPLHFTIKQNKIFLVIHTN